jgi:hypothetical protein
MDCLDFFPTLINASKRPLAARNGQNGSGELWSGWIEADCSATSVGLGLLGRSLRRVTQLHFLTWHRTAAL